MSCIDINGCTQKFSVGKAIRSALLADSTIVEYVGSNIFPLVGIEEKVNKKLGPFITYQRAKYTRNPNRFSVLDKAVMRITIVTEDYDTGLDIAEFVDEILSKGVKYGDCNYEFNLYDSYEIFEDLKYCQIIEYQID